MSAPTPSLQRIVITGGPGSGKSTLIEALARLGYSHMPEAGRAIIQSQVMIGGQALPWADRAAFAEWMLCWELRSFAAADPAGSQAEATAVDIPAPHPVFFDRGLPDVAGYLALCGLPIPAHLDAAIRRFRYATRVFIAPPWQDIFTQDAERRQDWAEAVRTYDAMVSVYERYGYTLIELPRCAIPERVAFVLQALGSASFDGRGVGKG